MPRTTKGVVRATGFGATRTRVESRHVTPAAAGEKRVPEALFPAPTESPASLCCVIQSCPDWLIGPRTSRQQVLQRGNALKVRSELLKVLS